jgi:hypothetical protein
MISLDVPKRKKIKFEHEITQVNSILRYSIWNGETNSLGG